MLIAISEHWLPKLIVATKFKSSTKDLDVKVNIIVEASTQNIPSQNWTKSNIEESSLSFVWIVAKLTCCKFICKF